MVAKSNAMNKTAAMRVLVASASHDSCFGQQQDALCPRHIETPTYPPIGRTAHLIGKVVLTLSLDADGKVSDVKVANEDDKGAGPLRLAAIENIRLWTLRKAACSALHADHRVRFRTRCLASRGRRRPFYCEGDF